MEESVSLWLVIAAGAASGLVASIVTYALLALPLIKVKARHDLKLRDDGAHVESYVSVANVRGRPVRIEGSSS